jgi:putative ABC transport system permease protein
MEFPAVTLPSLWLSTLVLGLAFIPATLGMFLAYRIMRIPDLTVDGSLPLGAVVTAALVTNGGSPWLALAAAVLAGSAAGAVSGLLATRLRIGLMAGILVMTALYTVNLRVLGERSNVSLLYSPTVLSGLAPLVPNTNLLAVLVYAALSIGVGGLVYWFLQTEVGLALQASGDNERMARAAGIDCRGMQVLCLAIGNGLVALSGSLLAQYQGYADVNMGLGTILVCIASLLVGELVLRPAGPGLAIAGAAIGAIIYRAAVAVALQIGLSPTDMKLATAVIVGIALAGPLLQERLTGRVGARVAGSPLS